MAYNRKPRYFRVKFVKPPGRTRRRIIIDQPPDRPIKIRQRDLLDREFLSEDTWWFIKHRRGVRQVKIGVSPLEARAVSKSTVRGTLPERIVYKALLNMRLVPGVDFDFQSSLQGGRLELGGMVADFLFPIKQFVLNVQGPTHDSRERQKKDEEQEDTLADMGYDMYYLDQATIYDHQRLWDRLRAIFNYGPRSAGGLGIESRGLGSMSNTEWDNLNATLSGIESALAAL